MVEHMYDDGVLEGLAEAVKKLDICVDGAALVRVLAIRDQLDARIAEAVGAFDAAKLWDIDADTSMTAWLRHHGGMTSRAAKHLASMSSKLRSLPVCSAAYADGSLSGGKVEAMLAHLDGETLDMFADQEPELVPYLLPLTVAGVGRAMAAWKERYKPDVEATEPERSLHLSKTLDDRYVLDGNIDAEGGAIAEAALRLATMPDDPDDPRTPATRRADAFIDVCRFFLDHQRSNKAGRHRPHINVVVNLEDLEAGQGARVVDGPKLDPITTLKLLCDSVLHRVVMSGRSAILDYGTSTRTIPAPLWSALVIRDEHCRFPGCDRPSTWCEAHHVVWVTHDGPTEPANLVLLCSRHHHRLHQSGWQAKLLPDATFQVTDADGRVRKTSPPRGDPPW